jgi:hypothetical protein
LRWFSSAAGLRPLIPLSPVATLCFLITDQYRVTLYPLQEGKVLARLRGQHPAASVTGELFTLDEGEWENWVYTTSGPAPESENAASPMASPMRIFLFQPATGSSY